MANVAQTNGLVLQDNLSGILPKSIMCSTVTGDSVALAVGDVVKLSGGSDKRGRPTVAQIAAGSAGTGQTPFGVVTAIAPIFPFTTNYRVASTATNVHVCIDPNAIYACNAHGTGIDNTDIGSVANVYVGTISTVFGTSAMQLDTGDMSASTDATLPLRLIGIVDSPNNADLSASDVTNARVLVKLNGTSITALGVVGV